MPILSKIAKTDENHRYDASENGPNTPGTFRFGDHACGVHPRRSRLAEARCRASGGGFGPGWTRIRQSSNRGRTAKLMESNRLLGIW